MNKTTRLAAMALSSSLMLTPVAAHADMLAGLYAGAQIWNIQSSGSFGTSDDVESFDFDNETKGSIWVALEHPIPLVPNLKLRYNQLDAKGDANISGFNFGGFEFNGNTTIDVQLDHYDFILYYEILDNDLISVDVGFNVKYGDFNVAVENSLGHEEEAFKGFIPLGYAAAEIGLPFSGLGVYSEVNWLSVNELSAHDIQLGAFWYLLDNLAIDATVRVGYRSIQFDIEDLSDLYMDAKFEGVYAGLELHF